MRFKSRVLLSAAAVLLLSISIAWVVSGEPDAVALVGIVEVWFPDGLRTIAVDDMGRIYVGSMGRPTSWTLNTQLSSGTPASMNAGQNGVHVAMANGDVYSARSFSVVAPIAFEYMGNVFGGAVGAETQSWTDAKAKYRE